MRILVTGAAGFVAPHLMRELRAHGHDVFGTDRTHAANDRLRVDLANPGIVREMLRQVRPDAIAHLAGWSHVGKSWNQPAECVQANVQNTLNLFTAADEVLPPSTRFLYVSSADVYGSRRPEELPMTELVEPRPESPYACSKLCAERILRMMGGRRGPHVVIARPFNHIGPGQSQQFVVPSFALQVAEIEAGQRAFFNHGNLGTRRDFLDVRDVVRAYRFLLESEAEDDLFIISRGVSTSIEDIVHELFAIAGIEAPMKEDSALVRPFDTPEFRGCSERLRQRTGWEPRIPLRQSLVDVLDEARRTVRARADKTPALRA